MTAIVSAVTLYNNSHINHVVDPSPSSSPSFSFLQLMNSSLDAILATGSEAIGGYSNGGYGGSGGAITSETERRRSSAPSGAVALYTHQQHPLAETPSTGISSAPALDSFHHAITQDLPPPSPSPLAYHPAPSQDILYSSSSPSQPNPTAVTLDMHHESSSTSNSTTSKRTAPDEYAEGSSSRSSKKNRKSRTVSVAAEDKDIPAAEKHQFPASSSSSPVVHQKEEEKQSASQPPSAAMKPPVPPRSPSPPHDLHKPAVPSPLCPSVAAPCIPPRPLTRRRSRSNEIALLKFALDPWLRLSRSLEGSKAAAAGSCKQAFNPATFPSAGNLRDLRAPRSYAPSYSNDYSVDSCGGFELSLPFNFGATASEITFGGFGSGDLAAGVKWNLVDA
ncbi:hypothetical protein FRB90_011365 [Tulasnella sp. 427]|nr:hypothetical protein FRB90_011365 [Tulasnella sp. 427]